MKGLSKNDRALFAWHGLRAGLSARDLMLLLRDHLDDEELQDALRAAEDLIQTFMFLYKEVSDGTPYSGRISPVPESWRTNEAVGLVQGNHGDGQR